MVDIRIYRAAFLLVLPAIVIVMFSLGRREAPLQATLAPDAFDSAGAYATTRDLVKRFPDRRPGTDADASLGQLVEGRLGSLVGFETARDDFTAEYDGKDVSMANVTGALAGSSNRQLVVMAARDAQASPGASSAADTSVLLELATALAGVRHHKTIVFVSTDGSYADHAGARRFVSEYPDRDKVDAVLVLEDSAAAFARRPFLIPWSSEAGRSSLELLRTADSALMRETGEGTASESPIGQFVRQAWPLTLRAQGPLLGAGLDALTFTGHGEVPRSGEVDGLDRISRLRLIQVGKAALSTVLALDSAARPEAGPSTYLVTGHNRIPGWAVSLLALSLIAPVLVAALDGFARARRRGRPIGRWARWALAAGAPFLVVLIGAWLFRLFGWLPDTVSEALAPASGPSFAEAAPPLAALAVLFALGWVVLRPLLVGSVREERTVNVAEAGVALATLLSLELILAWAFNPFAALLLVPAAHVALSVATPQRPRRPVLVGSMVAAALLLPALVLLYYGARLDLGLHLERYALLLVSSSGSVWSALIGSAIAGSVVSTVLLALARPEGDEDRRIEITVRGPQSYAGPGSLGGTESALRR